MPASRSVGLRAMQPVAAVTPVVSSRPYPSVAESYWKWRDYDIRYQFSGSSNDGEALVLVHGFGANADHWRKNTAQLARKGYRVYAIDLLGYGYSSKPDPRKQEMNSIYNFSTWGEQLVDFVEEVVGQPSFMICNSVGGLSGMEACISRPDLVRGVQSIFSIHWSQYTGPPWTGGRNLSSSGWIHQMAVPSGDQMQSTFGAFPVSPRK